MKYYFLLLLIILQACIARPIVKITDQAKHQEQNERILKSVLQYAKNGDWLVTRGYHAVDNLVANATSIPISHVAVYDSATQTVIEAEGKGIHETALTDFVNKSYRLLIIRPRWINKENQQKALVNAQKLVGESYDFLGTIGFNYPQKYYCSELAISIYKEWFNPSEKFPQIIKPGELYLYGKILYDSLPRDEMN